jgi:autotransporter-associated beta strand protein
VTLQSQGGTIDTNGNNATLSGTISGPGGLTKVGLGTLTLSGSSTYAGATNVNAGTLQAGAVNALSPFSAFTVADGATLELNNFNQTIGSLAGAGSVMLGSATLTTGNDNTSTTFSGTISGRGGLTKIGAGTLTLSGNNSYSGGTTINAGTLAVSSDSNLGNSSGGLAFGGGTLQFLSGLSTTRGVTLNAGGGTFDTNGNNATLGGPISGAGGLTKIGAGTLTLAGGNSYSGGTALNAGTLAVGSSNALGTGALTFANGTTLQAAANGLSLANAMTLNGSNTVDTQANALTLSGTLSGTGALTKIGSGTLTLSGSNTYSGATAVNAGTLIVNGSIANSAVTVNSGALLAGTGTVGTTTINSGGTFAPGPTGAPGTMTVAGNLAFQSGALYLVQVNPATASSANVTAGGNATLAGTVQAAFATGSYVSRTYTILSAAGGLNGTTFNTLTTTNLPAGFTANLSYTASDVILNLTATLGQPSGPSGPGALGTGAFSGNQRNVANALNNFFNAGGALPPAFVTIFGLTGANLANALTLLSGEAAIGGQQVAFQFGNQFLGLMGAA